MNKTFTTLTMLSLSLFCVCVNSNAKADLVIEFSADDGTTFSNLVTASLGETVTVALFARETDGMTTLSTNGLLNIGVRGMFDPEFGRVITNSVSNQFGLFADSNFDNDAGQLNLAGGSPTFAGVTGSNIKLGEFQFEITESGRTLFSFGDFDPTPGLSDFTEGATFADLDPLFFPASRESFELSIATNAAVVPEPSVLGMMFAALVGVAATTASKAHHAGF